MSEARDLASSAELALDAQILRSKNWALISQEHSTSYGHADAEGLCTIAVVVDGEKIWWVRNSDEDRGEQDVYDLRFFETVKEKERSPVPQNKGTWAPVILRKGDMM